MAQVLRQHTTYFVIVLFSAAALVADAQTASSTSSNNPFAPNPKSLQSPAARSEPIPKVVVEFSSVNQLSQTDQPTSISKASGKASVFTANIDKDSTNSYTIGPSDVLEIYVDKQRSKQGQHLVSDDGAIDFPLAGGKIVVASKTASEVESELRKVVSVPEYAQFTVRVIERASHSVEVSGSVGLPGVVHIQRDAVPLFVLNATVFPEQGSKLVKLVRVENGESKEKTLDLAMASDVLIIPGDRIEYLNDSNSTALGYFYIAGKASITGKQDLMPNTTLSNIVAMASTSRESAKRVRVRTRSSDGALRDLEFDVRSIKSGKSTEVKITHGSIVEFLD